MQAYRRLAVCQAGSLALTAGMCLFVCFEGPLIVVGGSCKLVLSWCSVVPWLR